MSDSEDLSRILTAHTASQADALAASREASQAARSAAALAAEQAITIARIEERQEAHQALVAEQLSTIKRAIMGNGAPGLMQRVALIETRSSKALGYALGVAASVSVAWSVFVGWVKAK